MAAPPKNTMVEGDTEKPSHNIPEAFFIEDVDAYMAENSGSAEDVLRKLEEQHNKYNIMDGNLRNKKKRLLDQMPDLERSREIVLMFKNNQDNVEIETMFPLAEDFYCKATIPPTDKVKLWLGAGIMLEYNLEDAEQLLNTTIETAKTSLNSTERDLHFIKDQLTTTEVCIARIYNWDVKRRQKEKQGGKKA